MSRRGARILLTVAVMMAVAAGFAALAAPGGRTDCPRAGGLPMGGGFWLVRAAADHLGVTPGTIKDELRQGKTLAQVAAAHGKTRESLRAALIAEWDRRFERQAQGELKLTADEVRVLRGIAARAVDLALDRKWQIVR